MTVALSRQADMSDGTGSDPYSWYLGFSRESGSGKSNVTITPYAVCVQLAGPFN